MVFVTMVWEFGTAEKNLKTRRLMVPSGASFWKLEVLRQF